MSTHIVLNGLLANREKANTMQAKQVKAFANDKLTVWFKAKHTMGGWEATLKTHKGKYLLHGGFTGKHFEGICAGVLVKVDVKKIVAHLTYE